MNKLRQSQPFVTQTRTASPLRNINQKNIKFSPNQIQYSSIYSKNNGNIMKFLRNNQASQGNADGSMLKIMNPPKNISTKDALTIESLYVSLAVNADDD